MILNCYYVIEILFKSFWISHLVQTNQFVAIKIKRRVDSPFLIDSCGFGGVIKKAIKNKNNQSLSEIISRHIVSKFFLSSRAKL